MWTWLKRVDPEERMNRWSLAPRCAPRHRSACGAGVRSAGDAVGVQPGLFDVVALVRLWGSHG